MPNRRRTFSFVLIAALAVGAWLTLRPGAFEVVVLRTFDGESDHFTSLWVLDDDVNDLVWIRAHRPDRRWLAEIQSGGPVELRRAGRSQAYVARVYDDDRTRAWVAEGFRGKYGLADVVRELSQGSDTVPVRLRTR